MFQYIKTWATTTTTILWLIVLIQVSQAQTSTLTPAYSLKKGLPSSTINHIAEDTNSVIWIATENGLKILNKKKRAVPIQVLERARWAVTKSMIPRGLAAAVLATYPITMGLPNAEAYPQMIFFIILL